MRQERELQERSEMSKRGLFQTETADLPRRFVAAQHAAPAKRDFGMQ
jgi:hypothetical protein